MAGHIFIGSCLSAIPAVVGSGEVEGGEVVTVDENEAAAHVAPHHQRLAVNIRELGIELEKQRVVYLNVAARFFLAINGIAQHLVAWTCHTQVLFEIEAIVIVQVFIPHLALMIGACDFLDDVKENAVEMAVAYTHGGLLVPHA